MVVINEHTCPVKDSVTGTAKRGGHPTGQVTREQWLAAGLDALAKRGVDGLQVGFLAKSLDISRSGFYWHFGSRKEYLKELQSYWAQTYTHGIAAAVGQLRSGPRQRLAEIPRMIGRLGASERDPPMWVWANADKSVRKTVDHVRDVRMNFVRELIRECGFEGADLEVRTRLFVAYFSWDGVMFGSDALYAKTEKVDAVLDLILASPSA